MAATPKRPTIADVARLAGVSNGTVSFTLNDRPGVAAATRERVLAACEELGWTPDARARALSTSRSSALGLVIARPPELLGSDPFFAPFIAGIESVLALRGHVLVLQVIGGDGEERAYRRLASEGRVDGVFLTDLRVQDPRPALLRRIGMPALAVGRQRGGPLLPSVLLDDLGGIAAAVEHLVALGHRRVAYVGGPDDLVHGADRHQAWLEAVTGAGLVPGPDLVGDFTAAGGAKATAEAMAADPRPTAVVYANDLMAIAGIHQVVAAGLRVPEDVSVTGFDDVELAAHVSPPLTTVTTDAMAWGAQAATRLLDLVDGRAAPALQDTDRDSTAVRLVVRGSTAAPATTA